VSTHPARRLWQVLEPLHGVVYFSPGVREAGTGVGLKGFWDTYFAFRAAPLGPVAAGTVLAAFAGFHPAMVARALPSAWSRATPDACLQARLALCVEALRTAGVDEAACAEAVPVLREAVVSADPTGRPLFAANAEQPVPDDPVGAVWHLATCLREHRGDGHVAALVVHGVSGLEAHLLQVARGTFDADTIRRARGWDEGEWEACAQSLHRRGFLGNDGALTASGRALLDDVERRTDDAHWHGALAVLGDAEVDAVARALTPAATAVWRAGWIPHVSPTGLPRPV
jgi:hypothetical protein